MERDDKDKVTIPVKCRNCGKTVYLKVFPDDLTRFEQGMMIQEAFPYLEPEKRELLLSGLCPDCWNNMFSELDDD